MTKRIFYNICIVAVAVFLAALFLIMGVLYGYFSDVQRQQLKMQLDIVAQGAASQGPLFFENMPANAYRITWIDNQGRVLYDSDSDSANMENHLEREEISAALQAGYGESSRYSTTLLEKLFYAAKLLPDGTVMRLAVSQSSVLQLILGMLQPICVIFLLILILAILLATSSAKKIVQPLNQMDLENPLSNKAYDELTPLLRRIASQQQQLKQQQQTLRQKQQELETITRNLQDGLILLNEAGQIISINPAAQQLLAAPAEYYGAELLEVCRNLELQSVLQQVLQGQPAERTISIGKGFYRINANPIMAEGQLWGAAMLIFDVTEQAKSEQARREFTANVSHELKTPLHSISGYAELLQNGLVKPEDIQAFAGCIYNEAQRLVQLVEDIISLSHLDEGAQDMPWADVDILAAAQNVLQKLEGAAKANRISLHLSGSPAVIKAIPPLLHSIIYNLCENAIKYNQPEGQVNISIRRQADEVCLVVQDTGIGIAPEHRQRIFERFYRVDKSHSQNISGTGLGLSIVKHAVLAHHARTELESRVGEGTVFRVFFPKAN